MEIVEMSQFNGKIQLKSLVKVTYYVIYVK
jgi:hypothetical protein